MKLPIKIVNKIIHNIIIHPLIAFLPNKIGVKIHNKHSNFTWGKYNRDIWISIEDMKVYDIKLEFYMYEKTKIIKTKR